MKTRLLQRVREKIADRPERFCAAQWAFARNKRDVLDAGAQPEGFRCCIAGHVLLEERGGDYDEEGLLCEGGFHDTGYLWQRAAEAAGLTKAQRNELFFPSQWDAPFKKEYYLSGRDEEADVCAAYITHFLEKHAAGGTAPPEEAPTRAATDHAAPDRPPVAGEAGDRRGDSAGILRRAFATLVSVVM